MTTYDNSVTYKVCSGYDWEPSDQFTYECECYYNMYGVRSIYAYKAKDDTYYGIFDDDDTFYYERESDGDLRWCDKIKMDDCTKIGMIDFDGRQSFDDDDCFSKDDRVLYFTSHESIVDLEKSFEKAKEYKFHYFAEGSIYCSEHEGHVFYRPRVAVNINDYKIDYDNVSIVPRT